MILEMLNSIRLPLPYITYISTCARKLNDTSNREMYIAVYAPIYVGDIMALSPCRQM